MKTKLFAITLSVVMLAACMVMAPMGALASDGPVIGNPGFEKGGSATANTGDPVAIEDWVYAFGTNSAQTLTAAEGGRVRNGDYALKLKPMQYAAAGMVTEITDLEPGKKYTAGGWFYALHGYTDTGTTAQYDFFVQAFVVAGSVPPTEAPTAATPRTALSTKPKVTETGYNGQWTYLPVNFTAEELAPGERYYLGVLAAGGFSQSQTGIVYWDDIKITPENLMPGGDFDNFEFVTPVVPTAHVIPIQASWPNWKFYYHANTSTFGYGIVDPTAEAYGAPALGDSTRCLYLKTTNSAFAFNAGVVFHSTSLTQGSFYKMSAMVYGLEANSKVGIAARATASNGSGAFRFIKTATFTEASTEWRQISMYFYHASATVSDARVEVCAGGQVLMDNIMVEEVPATAAIWFCDNDGFDITKANEGDTVFAHAFIPASVHAANGSKVFLTAEYGPSLSNVGIYGVADFPEPALNVKDGNTFGNAKVTLGSYPVTTTPYEGLFVGKEITVGSDIDSMKFFLWNNMGEIKPLAKAAQLTVNQ